MSEHEPVLLEYRPQRRLLGGYREVLVPTDPGSPALPRRWSSRRLPGQRRSPWTVVLPLVAAVLLGLAAGVAPAPVAGLLVAAGVAVGLLLRLEWAAMVVVAASVFEDYLGQVEPRITKLLALVLAVSWVIWRCSGRKRPTAPNPVLAAALAFTMVIALATAFHNNGDAGQHVVVRYVGFLVVLLVLADALRDRLTPTRLARVYVAACAAAALCGIATFALGDDRRVGGPIGDPNDLAFFLLPAVALGPAVRGAGPQRRLWDVATVVVVVGIAGTLSRGALVGLAGMLVVALVTGMVRARVLAGLMAAVSLAVVVVVMTLPGLVSVSLQQKGVVADQNVSERLDLWSAAAQMTIEHPVIGMGPGAFSLEHQDYTTGLPDDVNHPLDVAHNTWLEVSSELGLVGLAAFVAVLGLAFAEAWRGWRRRGDPVGAAVCAALVGTALAATFVTEQYYLPFWLLAALAVGVGHRGRAR
ncbi:O-antigen ligase family protein [Nocardioides sp.]|uniref:O-antigen ligase family protein n=1 Tax=Nocardioides sp. TaxID=35761 RepID=UPI00378338CC